MRQGRKRKVILDDGNCLFRAVAHIMYETEDKHAAVHQILVRFTWHNRPVFQKYITNGTFEQHVEIVTREGAWGTQVEPYVTASYYRLPVYIFSPHPQNNKHRWFLFEPEQCAHLSYKENFRLLQINHIELCHTTGNHFDCVLNLNNAFPTSPPQLDYTSSYISL